MSETEKTTGFVAFLDILGFKDFISKEGNLKQLFDHYDSIFVDEKTGTESVEYLVFSDTIILYSLDDSIESFKRIARKTSNFLFDLLKQNIPIRGCLSFGDIFVQKREHGTIISGNSIIDAYEYEENQNWTGIMISPTLLKKYKKFDEAMEEIDVNPSSFFPNIIVPYGKIPLYDRDKKETEFDGFAIFPISSSDTISTTDYDEILKILKWNKLTAPNQNAQLKFDNTIAFLYEQVKDKLEDSFAKQTY